MPVRLREQIAADVSAIAADPAIRDRLAIIGATARGSTPAQFADDIEAQRARIAEILAAPKVTH